MFMFTRNSGKQHIIGTSDLVIQITLLFGGNNGGFFVVRSVFLECRLSSDADMRLRRQIRAEFGLYFLKWVRSGLFKHKRYSGRHFAVSFLMLV